MVFPRKHLSAVWAGSTCLEKKAVKTVTILIFAEVLLLAISIKAAVHHGKVATESNLAQDLSRAPLYVSILKVDNGKLHTA